MMCENVPGTRGIHNVSFESPNGIYEILNQLIIPVVGISLDHQHGRAIISFEDCCQASHFVSGTLTLADRNGHRLPSNGPLVGVYALKGSASGVVLLGVGPRHFLL